MFRRTFLAATVAATVLASTAYAGSKKDIVDTAAGAGSFTTLVAAVEAAGLADTLKGPGPFTVFAPTDEAFAALPPGTVDSLLLPENKDQLVAILTYHVVPGEIESVNFKQGEKFTTVNGDVLTMNLDNGNTINGAPISALDIEASNGVIQVIDSVLIPNEGS